MRQGAAGLRRRVAVSPCDPKRACCAIGRDQGNLGAGPCGSLLLSRLIAISEADPLGGLCDR